MKQVVVGPRGSVLVEDMSLPSVRVGEVCIATDFSVISTGTETTARSNSGGALALARKAVSDPALRAKARDRVRSQGLRGTLDQVEARASRATVLGYSAVGRVLAVGDGVDDLAVGQRVAAGSQQASHAEVITVPRLLVSAVPDAVSGQDAAYTTLASIALHAHRLSRLALGESVAVVGLGLVGQLAAQIAAAAGCRVFGTDPQSWRCDRARLCVSDGIFVTGMSDLASMTRERGEGGGVDAVVVAAGGADTGLANSCLKLLRDRGRLVVVGAVSLALDRDIIYHKELEVTVSRSYGPGRYDASYEERGIDYPIGYVRWTEGRNLGAVLELMARGRLNVAALTTATVPIAEAPRAYELAGRSDEHLGVLLSYPANGAAPPPPMTVSVPSSEPAPVMAASAPLRLGLIGPGTFAVSILGPALKDLPDILLATVIARNSAQAKAAAARLGAGAAETDVETVFQNQNHDAVIIATRHDTHADLAGRALAAGKHVFVEKPLGLTVSDCESVVDEARQNRRILMVDFNRRFSPLSVALKRDVAALPGAMTVTYRINAGTLPMDHWLLDPVRGGGQLLGEGVHFLDFLCWLFDGDPTEVLSRPAAVADSRHEAICTLIFGKGRSGTILYTTHGSPRTPKERIEVFGGGHTWVLEDFRSLERDGKRLNRGRQQKGHAEALRNFVDAALGRASPGVTGLDGLRATRLALEVQGRWAPTTEG